MRKLRKLWYSQTIHSLREAVNHNVAQQTLAVTKRVQEATSYSNSYYKRLRTDNDGESTWVRVDGDFIEFTTTANTNITLHTSHNWVVECGGYVGCKICNRYGSFSSPTDGLRKPCRGTPPPSGTMREVGNLSRGKWPHKRKPVNKTQGQQDAQTQPTWPSRVPDPRPYFYRLRNTDATGGP